MNEPQQKTIRVRLNVDLQIQVPTDWDDSLTHFHVSEHNCLGNLVRQLCEEMEAVGPNTCNLCNRGYAEYLGDATPEEIGKYKKLTNAH